MASNTTTTTMTMIQMIVEVLMSNSHLGLLPPKSPFRSDLKHFTARRLRPN
jgi:hypothetical protein